ILREEMRRDENETAHAMVLDRARIDRGDGGAVAVPDKKPTAKSDALEQTRQNAARLVVHESERARQRDGRRLPIAGARIDQYASAGCGRQPVRKVPPEPDAAEPLVQHDDRRRRIGPRSDHAVFEPHCIELEKALVGELHDKRPTTRTSFSKLASTASPE